MSDVLFEKRPDGVALLTLNRPESMNAMGGELVPLLEAEKMGLLIWSPLAGGLLSGKYSRENPSPEGARRSGFDFPIVDRERGY